MKPTVFLTPLGAEAPIIGDNVVAEVLDVLNGIDVGINICVVAFVLVQVQVEDYFALVIGCASEQMFVVQLGKASLKVVVKELCLIQFRLSHAANELAQGDAAIAQQRFSTRQAF